MGYQIRPVKPAPEALALILDGIKQLVQGSAIFTTQNVIEDLVNGGSTLWLAADENGDYSGFVVSVRLEGAMLLPWAHVEKGKKGALDALINTMVLEAKFTGAKKVLFTTSRNAKATDRRMKRFGFAPCATQFSLEVE